jgi:hypothetical protein
MSQQFMSPEQMAHIYLCYMHRSAIKEIMEKLTLFKNNPQTVAYWSAVLRHVEK